MIYITRIPSFIALLGSVVLIVGLYSFASACPFHEGGHLMYCHLAEQVSLVLAYLIAVLCFCNFLSDYGMFKCGTDLAILLIAVVLIMIPDQIIPLCEMENMRCRLIMQPFVKVVSIVLLIISLVDFIFHYIQIRFSMFIINEVAKS